MSEYQCQFSLVVRAKTIVLDLLTYVKTYRKEFIMLKVILHSLIVTVVIKSD